jgi:hypothetical protein
MNIIEDQPRQDRRGLLTRIGAATMAASMATVIRTKRAEAASCNPPGYPNCHGHPGCSCNGGGCGTTPHGGCCWAYVDDISCRVYKCCDVTCANGVLGICRYLVCHCC